MHLLGTLTVALAILTPGPQTRPTGDLARMQGAWRATTASGAVIALTIQDAQGEMKTQGPDDKPITIKATIQLDESTQPRALDWQRATRDDGQAMPDLKAIYDLQGDTLRLCAGGPGKPRPTAFAEAEDGPTITTFQRVQPRDRDRDSDPSPPLGGDLARLQGTWRSTLSERGPPLVVTVRGARLEVRTTGPDGEPITVSARLQLDEKARPKTWTSTQRTQADGRSMPDLLAIYELEGDTLKVCNNGPGKPRPAELREGPDGLPIITIFTRVPDPSRP